MLKGFYRRLFPRLPVAIPIECDRIRAVRELEQALLPLRWQFATTFKGIDGVAGRVTPERVSLYRVQTMPGRSGAQKTNAWKPCLRGRLRYVDGQVHLCGEFRMHPFVQGFSTFWLAFTALFSVCTLGLLFFAPLLGIEEKMPLQIPATGLALFGLGCGGVIWGWRWSEDDMAYIEQWVRENTSLPPSEDDPRSGANKQTAGSRRGA